MGLNTEAIRNFLKQRLSEKLNADAMQWLDEADAKCKSGEERALNLAISLVVRKIEKLELELSAEHIAEAQAIRINWHPERLSTDQAARLFLMLARTDDAEAFNTRLEAIFRTSDMREQITFYAGLPLYPGADQYLFRGTEGLRTNIKPVFQAVAHFNPYPSEQFPENAWNHMVLKSIFIESTLKEIIGLDERANPALMTMLVDYAHERWAASRSITPELWRCVGPYADDRAINDLEKVLKTGLNSEKQAAVLSLQKATHAHRDDLLALAPEIDAQVKAGELTWEDIDLEEVKQ